MEDKDPLILYNQWHDRWWPGDTRRHNIDTNGIDLAILEPHGFRTIRVNHVPYLIPSVTDPEFTGQTRPRSCLLVPFPTIVLPHQTSSKIWTLWKTFSLCMHFNNLHHAHFHTSSRDKNIYLLVKREAFRKVALCGIACTDTFCRFILPADIITQSLQPISYPE